MANDHLSVKNQSQKKTVQKRAEGIILTVFIVDFGNTFVQWVITTTEGIVAKFPFNIL